MQTENSESEQKARVLRFAASANAAAAEIERQQQQGKEVAADAAFAKPELYEALEERDVKYAISRSRQ